MATSFAIEVPGEANPLTDSQLFRTLQSASSSNPTQIQSGTKQLQRWEKQKGYYALLQSLFVDQRLPLEVRYLAIIQLKNGIDKYWRKLAVNAIDKEDKNLIRSRLLDSATNEPSVPLALQTALVIAKVARIDFPTDWPDAVSSTIDRLRQTAQAGQSLQLARTLLVLLHLTKELSTGRIQRIRQTLQAVTPELVGVLGNLYASKFGNVLGQLGQAQDGSAIDTDELYQGLLAIKALRRLLITGYEHPNRDQDVVAFWRLSIQHIGAILPAVQGGSLSGPSKQLLEKHMIQLAKLHHEMARDHPAAFALLPSSLELVQAYWGVVKSFGESFGTKEAVTAAVANASIGTDGDADDKSALEKFALKGLLIIRGCVKMVHNPTQTFKYRTPEDKAERIQATDLLRQHFLTEAFVQEVMETVVTRFFVFRASDLQEWEEEPEEWEKREEGDGDDWEFSIRSCSEKLFLDLAINYKTMLVQPLLSVFYSVATPDNEDVLFKDSVYTAIGLAAPVVHEHLDFDAFIQNVLVTEVQKQKPGFNILRRRAAILLGQWISVKVGESSRPLVYQIFQHLLTRDGQPLNDQVVRVTAGRQFKNIADDWEFKADQFLQYAEPILASLMHLIGEVELTETKMALLNTISVVVERLDHHISPFAERIVSLLPSLWEQSGDEHLMKQAILAILARLVNAMKADSLPLHSLTFPIIKGALEPGSETQVYLLEDALDLWHNMIVQTPSSSVSNELLELTPYIFPVFELGSESLRKALEIAESYALLAPQHMLSDQLRKQMFASLAELIGTLKAEANGLVCNLLEVIVRVAEKLGGADAVGQLSNDLVESGLANKLIQGLHGSWIAHCTTGPRAKDAPVDGIVETDYFSILARLILGSTSGFLATIAPIASAPPTSEGSASASGLGWLLEEWFSHFENIGDPSRRKLMCLALTSLLDPSFRPALERLQSLMTMWTDIVIELREGAEDAAGDSLVYNDPAGQLGEGPEAPEEDRRREMTYSDPVHQVNLPGFIRERFMYVRQGVPDFESEWLSRVDTDVQKAFLGLGIVS